MYYSNPQVYAVRHKDENIRALSRSGGIFTALSDYVLNQSGVVYGCVLDEKHLAVHRRAENETERDMMRGSKYIQSNLGDTFRMVKKDLDADKMVLFSGTSCQLAGLRSFLGKDYYRLICVDIVCHGVPSPAVWSSYLKWLEKKANSKVVRINFRNKKEFGWRAHIESVYFENGKVINSEVFKKLFMAHNILRPCCYKCRFKSVMHPGDITIADYWGIENAAPEFDDNKGVSLVLINNPIGESSFNAIKENVVFKETRIEDSMQPALVKPYDIPDSREDFWKDFARRDFGFISRKYADAGIINDIKRLLKRIKRKLLKK